jgi:eukaryotic-like serine/threonine-protein kinase
VSSAAARKQAEARVGSLLDGKWTLDGLLGYGGSAAVYAATHRNGKRAAVKILHAHCAADPELVARFVREGYLANKINHPGVVSVLDDDRADDGSVYLVMELLEGRSFERHGRGIVAPLSVVEALQVADDLLDILIGAHAIGLVHRDIKPANLFLTSQGQLKILDFGIARLAEGFSEGVTQTGMLMGTPAYMPPEQARGRWQDVDARSDLWAVGVTLASLMTGKRPRTADTPAEELLAAMMQPMPSLATLLPDAPPQVVAIIDRASAFERQDRFQSAAEMQAAVREARRALQGPAPFAPSMTLRFAPEVHPAPHASYGDGSSPPAMPSGSYGGGTMLTPPVSRHPSLPDPEPVPSLTTNRAMTKSSGPGPLTVPPRSSKVAIFLAVSGALALVGLVAVGVTVVRARHRPVAAIAEPTPPPVTSAPLTSAPLATAPVATAPSAPAEEPKLEGPDAAPVASAIASGTPEGRKKEPPAAKRPKTSPAGSADPNKFFDQRF